MPVSPEHPLPLEAIATVFRTREQASAARQAATEAASAAAMALALALEPDQLYQIELVRGDEFYSPQSRRPRLLGAVHCGKLVLAESIAVPMDLRYDQGPDYFRIFPLVPTPPDCLKKQPGHGMAIALAETTFTRRRLTVITRDKAKELVATNRVFNPSQLTRPQ